MVTFTASAPGTAASVWRDDERWAGIAPFDLETITSLVVVAAHPDDETIGAGGIMHACAARGCPCTSSS